MKIEPASKSDIPAMMRIERGEGYARLVGRWEAAQHAAAIENPSCRYYLAREEDDIAGFAILQNVGSENRCVRLRRIAVQHAGRGTGSRLLRSVLKICFDDLDAHRVELFVFEDNDRAHRAYLKNGFVEEGVVRDIHRDAEGTFRSMCLMSLLKPEWKRPA
ncbi:RimJ/RimL family protein N-acetyltransferase [Bradyrhizobium algeriense]|uniref:RimJ/RimL family protein N-acetyltransferase n=1 Tax=Bradyrhizobium algeriense TaxID=634784 RepID=A0ABU8BNB3_9BRAD